MKASELRIGNYYLDIDNKLREMSGYELWQMSVNENLGIMEYQPIPLTEEWLLKFGFKYNGFCYELNKHQLRFVDKFGIPYWIDSNFITNIRYVHQLQNLYFALKGEELEIKQNANN